ncbi:hypothetical protein SCALM49S_09180 [Streptomyces californicus]
MTQGHVQVEDDEVGTGGVGVSKVLQRGDSVGDLDQVAGPALGEGLFDEHGVGDVVLDEQHVEGADGSGHRRMLRGSFVGVVEKSRPAAARTLAGHVACGADLRVAGTGTGGVRRR